MGRRGLAVRHVANARRAGQCAARLSATTSSPPRDYFDAFLTYVHSQHADGKPYIGEYLDETTGQWINGKDGRSRYYNHSTFADLLITGVVGLRPRADDMVEVQPLLPDGTWNWFCLDGVKYHGHALTIIWDKDGTRYGRGQGLIVLADGKEIAHGGKIAKTDRETAMKPILHRLSIFMLGPAPLVASIAAAQKIVAHHFRRRGRPTGL